MPKISKHTCTQEDANKRLDKLISEFSEVSSRSQGALLISKQCVKVNGRIEKSSYKMVAGDQVEITHPEHKASDIKPFSMKLDIFFEDEYLLVVNKPSGLVVHPSAGHSSDTLVNGLMAHTHQLSQGFSSGRPGIVHRLDKDTSGLLVVAKNDQVHEHLAQQFKKKETHRIYLAIVLGRFQHQKTIQSYIARHPTQRKKNASIRNRRQIVREISPEYDAKGKWAITHASPLFFSNAPMTLLKVQLETGRTHQIRVHLSELGYPIVGDSLYCSPNQLRSIGNSETRSLISQMDRFALHAAELGFVHPISKSWCEFVCPLPQELQKMTTEYSFEIDDPHFLERYFSAK